MKIGIDATPLSIPFPCGTKHYAEGLIYSLAKIDKKNDYYLYSKKDFVFPKFKNFHKVLIPKTLPLFKRQFFMTFFARRDGVDIFHFLEPFGSLFTNNLKIITTVHDYDLGKINPDITNIKQVVGRLYAETVRFFNLKNSSIFLAVSQTTKNELSKTLGSPKRIITIHNAYNKKFRVVKKYKNLSKRYILCMGDYSPRKNILKIMKSYSLLDKNIKKKYKLKIIISTTKPLSNFTQEAQKLIINENVEFEIAPKLTELVAFYNKAVVFVFPSLYEGFGIPILEAMACGCPVITSNYGAMKEISGGAALLVNPLSEQEISNFIVKIIRNRKLRSELAFNGIKRAKLFNWNKNARETLKVYQKVYAEK